MTTKIRWLHETLLGCEHALQRLREQIWLTSDMAHHNLTAYKTAGAKNPGYLGSTPSQSCEPGQFLWTLMQAEVRPQILRTAELLVIGPLPSAAVHSSHAIYTKKMLGLVFTLSRAWPLSTSLANSCEHWWRLTTDHICSALQCCSLDPCHLQQ